MTEDVNFPGDLEGPVTTVRSRASSRITISQQQQLSNRTTEETESAAQPTNRTNYTARIGGRGRGSRRGSRGPRRGFSSSRASLSSRGRENGRGATFQRRGRGSRGTRSRGQRRKRGIGYQNEFSQDELSHRAAPNYVDVKVVEKIIGRVAEGMDLIDRAKTCFGQVQEELWVIHAYLKGIHGTRNTQALDIDNDATESRNTTQRLFSDQSMESMFRDGVRAEDVQLSLDPYSSYWQTNTFDYTNENCEFNQESHNQGHSMENNELQKLQQRPSVVELQASNAASFDDHGCKYKVTGSQADDEEPERNCKMEGRQMSFFPSNPYKAYVDAFFKHEDEETEQMYNRHITGTERNTMNRKLASSVDIKQKPKPRSKQLQKETEQLTSLYGQKQLDLKVINECVPTICVLDCKKVIGSNWPPKDHLGLQKIEQEIKYLESQLTTPIYPNNWLRKKQVSLKRKFSESPEANSDEKIKLNFSTKNEITGLKSFSITSEDIDHGNLGTEEKRAKCHQATTSEKIPVWKRVLQPSQELKEKRKERLKEITLGCQRMSSAEPKETQSTQNIVKHDDFEGNTRMASEKIPPNDKKENILLDSVSVEDKELEHENAETKKDSDSGSRYKGLVNFGERELSRAGSPTHMSMNCEPQSSPCHSVTSEEISFAGNESKTLKAKEILELERDSTKERLVNAFRDYQKSLKGKDGREDGGTEVSVKKEDWTEFIKKDNPSKGAEVAKCEVEKVISGGSEKNFTIDQEQEVEEERQDILEKALEEALNLEPSTHHNELKNNEKSDTIIVKKVLNQSEPADYLNMPDLK